MSSTYEKVITNRQRKRCRSPQRRSYCSHTTIVSSPIRSESSPCLLSLLENEEGNRRGELQHVWNPNPRSKSMLKYDFKKYSVLLLLQLTLIDCILLLLIMYLNSSSTLLYELSTLLYIHL